MRIIKEGGSGSGNFDHAGRPGEVGGSAKEDFEGYYQTDVFEGKVDNLNSSGAYLLTPLGDLWKIERGVEHADARTWSDSMGDPIINGGYTEIRVYPDLTSIISPEGYNPQLGIYISKSNPRPYSLIKAIDKNGKLGSENVADKTPVEKILKILELKEGGRGSGNFGHGGRIGVRGGAQAGILGPAQPKGGNVGAVMPAHDQVLSAVMYQSARVLKNASIQTGRNYDNLLVQLGNMLTTNQPVGTAMIVRELMMVYQVLNQLPSRGGNDPLNKLKASLVYSVKNLIRTGQAGPDLTQPTYVKDPFKRRAQYMGVNYQ